ncbi:O-acyltransferase like protein-like [Haliotis rubra]|uniref:O-acyltransferase like protein-like n=1 Tax=Haliotis rubra TaxID=36100 RepID=UPI001EE60AE9|nr:O-acyltransferase like protein-like [Haliotis rubra]
MVYEKPWCRIGTFAIGMMLGYILHTFKSRDAKMSPFLQGVGWLLALVAAGACTLATYDANAEGRPGWGVEARTAHETLYRPVWGLVLAWVIFMCFKGKAGFVDWMLSWDWWQPLSRLTYGAYLVHLMFIQTEAATARSLFNFTSGYIVYRFFGYTCMSFIFSFLVAILVEAPMLQLEKLVLS